MLMNCFMQVVKVSLSTKPLRFLLWVLGVTALYVIYLYIRNAERAKRELSELKKNNTKES